MAKIGRVIKENAQWIFPIIIIVISLLKGWWTMNDIKSFWDSLSPGKIMLYITLILVLIAFVITFFRNIRFAIPRSWTLKLGVYWDKELNPYCVVCKKPLSRSFGASNAFRCPNGHGDANGNICLGYGNRFLNLPEAREAIRNKEV